MDEIALVQVGLYEVIVRLLFALFLGIMVGSVYSFTFRNITYTSHFRNTIILCTPILAAIILTIGSNIALSLGLVGSLSIIRFRAVVKDSIDMFFLFWSIGEGIAIGAGQFEIASAIFFIILLGLFLIKGIFDNKLNILKKDFLLKIQYESKNHDDILSFIKENLDKSKIKSTFSDNENSLNEINILINAPKNGEIDLLNLLEKKGLRTISLSFNIFSSEFLNTP